MSLVNRSSLPNQTESLIQSHPETICALPHPESYRLRELDGRVSVGTHKRLVRAAIVDVVDEVHCEDNARMVKVYQVDPDAREHAEAFAAAQPSLPCGPDHTGFVNLGGGRFGCSAEACEATYDRDAIEAHLFDGGEA